MTSALPATVEQQYARARLSRDRRFDGVFFVAVTSTGIFCRPVCPARLPAERNVRYFTHATHALREGFRPCLRCRPDSAPQSYAWLGVTTTVRRAAALLSEIPAAPVADIAARLGISTRYLHVLMQRHFGVAPKTFQIMQRVLFAKQLLQQTELGMDDVAVSAGFASTRQLQRAIKQYCQLTPGDLRRGQPQTGGGPSLTVLLRYRPPYNWPQVRDFLKARAIEQVEHVGEQHYRRNLGSADGDGTLTAEHLPDMHGFRVTLQLANLSAAHRVLNTLRRVLDLDAEPGLIDTALNQAGLPTAARTEGLRLPGCWSEFEAGCRAIVGQQVSVKAAIGQVTALTHALQSDDKAPMTFPTPEAVAGADLAFLKMPGARKRALSAFAEYAAATSAEFDAEALLAIKGVGPWTVNYVRMRGASEPDIYLHGDLVVRKVASRFALRPDEAAPWRSYLTLQLWHLA
ncbi:helix-turn-helix domain-containing protein [Alteromonas sp. ASW11-19]|uniref:Helix-turn-helix domain-containing protein n=1 Tax=Alteromonas salexigens TaxID=2982530 RepID=A0ABT2VNB3_9ALTE|nr:AlkA N-terminal domain-containing protein [Alteromonas salexigens]MCU7553454.1 helix-turn-helix domain-containing protein [Alteromonas salexigens]